MESKSPDVVLLRTLPSATFRAMVAEAQAYLEGKPPLPLRPGAVAVAASKAPVAAHASAGWRGLPLRTLRGASDMAASHLRPGKQDPAGFAWTKEARDHFPATRAYLESLGVPLLLVRLLTLDAGGRIPRHSDGVSFARREHAVRTHIPLVTHPDVTMTIDGTPHHLAAGAWWFTAVEKQHSVRNETPDVCRLQLVIDAVPTSEELKRAAGLLAA